MFLLFIRFTVNVSSEKNSPLARFEFENYIDLLVSLVEKRPRDKTLDTFSDGNKKRKTRREVFCLMAPEFEMLEHYEHKLDNTSHLQTL